MTPAQNTEIKTISRNHPEFRLEAYASISPSELVVFAVQLLQADELTASVEDVVSICFRLFPHSFSLKNYFYWPDSALVMRRLHDAKERGYLKGNAIDGFATKVKGKQIAKRVAKILGVSLPAPQKPEAPVVPAPVEIKVEPETPIKVEEVEKPVVQPVEVPAPIVEKKKPSSKKLAKASSTKAKKKTTAVKKASKPVAIAKPAKKKQVKKVVSAPKPQLKPKPRTSGKKEKSSAQAKPQKTQPMQLTLGLQPVPAKKKAEAPASRPRLKNEAKPVKVQAATPTIIPVSKEEKEKAGKVVRQMERSDAYLMFKRNGKRAHISEFDFRNMLFATMESPAETLKRNVDTFKRYAGVQQRNDLLGFLDFCEQHFAVLLTPKTKQPIKKLRF